MRLISVAVGSIALLAACSDSQSLPTTPSNVTMPAPPPPAPPATHTVSGVVRAAGVPVPGARVVVVDQGSAPTTTDGNGFYTISGVMGSVEFSLSPMLSASKPGYFTAIEFVNPTYAPITTDRELHFNLDPLLSIALGDVIRGRLDGSEPSVCSHWGYGTGACQRFAVTVPQTGTLEVTLTSPQFEFDVDVVGPDGTFVIYDPHWAPLRRHTIPVQAGSTYEIRLVGGCCRIREFELTTALR